MHSVVDNKRVERACRHAATRRLSDKERTDRAYEADRQTTLGPRNQSGSGGARVDGIADQKMLMVSVGQDIYSAADYLS